MFLLLSALIVFIASGRAQWLGSWRSLGAFQNKIFIKKIRVNCGSMSHSELFFKLSQNRPLLVSIFWGGIPWFCLYTL